MIHYFNPGHETAVNNASPYYMSPANVLQMQYDLSFLPAWYGNTRDFVFVDIKTDLVYIHFLKQLFPDLPSPVTLNTISAQPYEEICIWGISPQSIHFFTEINQKQYTQFKLPDWKAEYNYLNSRKAARDCLNELIKKIPEIQNSLIPCFCNNIKQIEEILEINKSPVLAKAPYSSSGRGLVWIKEWTKKEKELLTGILKKQGSVSLEPVLDKLTDFSMQFMCDGKGTISFEGYSLFETNNKGAYQGNYLYSQETITNLLIEHVSLTLLEKIKDHLLNILKEKYAFLYKGCIGVDMMIYKDHGEYKLHPCVEINMRYNMGYLSIQLQENYIEQFSTGKFRIEYNSGEKVIYKKHLEMMQQFPLQVKNGKIKNGYLSLCPVNSGTKYLAYIIVN